MFKESTYDAEVGSSTAVDRSVPYVFPWRTVAPDAKVPKGKYAILLPYISSTVSIDGSLVGRLYKLGFFDHDFHDDKKFPDFNTQYYMNATVVDPNRPPIMNFQKWAIGLETYGITNVLDIPHFGRSTYITYYVKTLLSCIHGGYLWLNPPVSIDAELIHRITGLPMVGEDPAPLFLNKKTDKIVAAQVSTQHGPSRGKRNVKVN